MPVRASRWRRWSAAPQERCACTTWSRGWSGESRWSASSSWRNRADERGRGGDMTKIEPLRDGHGRFIRDVRVSVTDRCNFRCQYCMPAEGLPWLERDQVLSFEEIERLVSVLASMGVCDIRLTGGEPLVRRDFPRLAGMLAARRRRRRPQRHDERLPARARRRGAREGRHQPLQRLRRLAAARPLLRDDPARRAPARAARPRGARAVPRRAPDQDQRRRHARLHRDRDPAVRRVRARRTPTRCASSSSCRSTPTISGIRASC